MAPSASQTVKKKVQGEKREVRVLTEDSHRTLRLAVLFTPQKATYSLSSEVEKEPPLIQCYGLDCVPQNPYVAAVTPKVTVFGNGAF